MDYWLKRAEDLFEVVDRRAKLVVNELSDEQSIIPPAASNRNVAQAKRLKSKAKVQKRASADEKSGKDDSRQEESISQPSVVDCKPEEMVTASTLKNGGLTPGTSTAESNIEMHDKIENNAQFGAALSDISSDEVRKHDNDQMEDASAVDVEVVTSSSNSELGGKNSSPLSDIVPSASAAPGTELGHGSIPIDSGQNISWKIQMTLQSLKRRDLNLQSTIQRV